MLFLFRLVYFHIVHILFSFNTRCDSTPFLFRVNYLLSKSPCDDSQPQNLKMCFCLSVKECSLVI